MASAEHICSSKPSNQKTKVSFDSFRKDKKNKAPNVSPSGLRPGSGYYVIMQMSEPIRLCLLLLFCWTRGPSEGCCQGVPSEIPLELQLVVQINLIFLRCAFFTWRPWSGENWKFVKSHCTSKNVYIMVVHTDHSSLSAIRRDRAILSHVDFGPSWVKEWHFVHLAMPHLSAFTDLKNLISIQRH